jgi:ElaB/YqjD/DUF883 family membrane-anchored ribosome-binding protein
MGAPIRTSSDIPDFSTYPSSPSDQSPTADHLLPERGSAARLDEIGTQVGNTLGVGYNALMDARERVMDRIDSVRSSMDAVFCTVRDRATNLAQDKFDVVRGQSQEQLRRARQYADANPLAVIAAAGVAGVLLGAGARAWRNNRG